MKDVAISLMFGLGAIICAVAGYKICETDHIALEDLRRSGYEVIRHAETHGEFRTNWVEVTRTDGRPLQCGR